MSATLTITRVRYTAHLVSGGLVSWEQGLPWEVQDDQAFGDALISYGTLSKGIVVDGAAYPPQQVAKITWEAAS